LTPVVIVPGDFYRKPDYRDSHHRNLM